MVEILMSCYREGRDAREDSRVLKAVRQAEKDGELKERLARQIEFDAAIASAIAAAEPPGAVRNRVLTAAAAGLDGSAWKTAVRHPAILAVVFGMLIIAGFLVYLGMKELDDFEGRDAIVGLLERTDAMSGAELELVDLRAGDLVDWMAMHGLEEFKVPEAFASRNVIGRRKFSQDGKPVVQLLVEENGMQRRQGVILMLFRSEDFGIDSSAIQDWRIVLADGWVSAIRAEEGECVAITFPGTFGEMEAFLKGLPESTVLR